MRRGDVIVVTLPGDFGKPRPAAIIQSDRLEGLDTVVVCPFTTSVSEEVTLRPIIEPDTINGLRVRSQAMVEKLTTFRLKRVTTPIGRLSDADILRVDQSIRFVLDLPGR